MSRIKGAKNLSKQEQAQILAQKNARLCSQEKIADNFGVTRRTVINLKESNVDEETRALSLKYQRALSARIVSHQRQDFRQHRSAG
jgi:DNA-binding XRE family transcriptional regulator